MNKEKEIILNKVLSEPDVPYLVSKKSINRLIERMQPETQDMKEYLIALLFSRNQCRKPSDS